MRQGEMHILNVRFCIFIPVLFPCFGSLLALRNWLGSDLCTIIIIQRHTLDLIRVDLIEQAELSFEILTGNIIFLNDVIVDRIRNLPDTQQIRIKLICCAFNHALCIRDRRLLDCHLESVVQKQADRDRRDQRKRGEYRHDDGLDI